MHSLRDCCATLLGCGNFADCGGSEEVVRADKVVGVPLDSGISFVSEG